MVHLKQSEFAFAGQARLTPRGRQIISEIKAFKEFGKRTVVSELTYQSQSNRESRLPVFINEFWTSKQRAASSLHEISYRACFKPQLPAFFIKRLSNPGDLVHDPFMGRGTTPLEAGLHGRKATGSDINPICAMMARPRFAPPTLAAIEQRLHSIPFSRYLRAPKDLLVFYYPDTLNELAALRQYLLDREAEGELDAVDDWIRMVALNRLTGHSTGFFSVYTLPPNQATSVVAQKRINSARNQTPPRRDVRAILLKKSRQLIKELAPTDLGMLRKAISKPGLFTANAWETPRIPSQSVTVVVTSPPFLNTVSYSDDNWLRCWFAGLDVKSIRITQTSSVDGWQAAMTRVFKELARVLTQDGFIAFEVGEVQRGRVRLEELTIPCALEAGLHPLLLLINDQSFTKTAHCWGVSNNSGGTNTNRVLLLQKP